MPKAAKYLRRLSRERLQTEAQAASASEQLQRYAAPWKGQLVLMCEKCSRRVERNGDPEQLGDVPRILRSIGKEDGIALRIVETGCLKLCPRDGIAVTTEDMLLQQPAEAALLRTREDVATLYGELTAEDRRRRRLRG